MSLPIIFIHRGNPTYLKYALKKARETNPDLRIILLGDKTNNCYSFIEHHHISYGRDAHKFMKIYEHRSILRFNFELFCFLRWFILRDFMKSENITKCVHIDLDVLLYCSVDQESKRFERHDMTLSRWSKYGCSAHISFINSVDMLTALCTLIMETYQVRDNFDKLLTECEKIRGQPWVADMSLLNALWQGHSEKIAFVETIVDNSCFDNYMTVSSGFEMINGTRLRHKNVRFIDRVPFAKHEQHTELIRLKAIYFHGYTKYLMKHYYRESNRQPFVIAERLFRRAVRFGKDILKAVGVKRLLHKKDQRNLMLTDRL